MFERKIIKDTSIPLPGGGDTHIHPFGPNENDFTITTRIPIDRRTNVNIHDKPWLPPNR
jgi:hypothetical protein